MSHPIYRILQFRIVGAYTISVAFDDGTEQIIDFQNVLAGELFGPLRDLNLFNQVSLDPEVHTLVWPNGETLTRRPCTIGRNTVRLWQLGRGSGNGNWLE